MEITIIGWYGTETIGDRAILAGIFRILSQSIGKFSVRLGSLYPFYTQRTVSEDWEFYRIASKNAEFSIQIFDSRNPIELRKNIRRSDILMVGGGPLMDLQEMTMLDYAFYVACRYKKNTVLMGCGWGPLDTGKCIGIAKKLVDKASLVIFRDDISKQRAIRHGCEESKIKSILDPAFVACQVFLEEEEGRQEEYIAINFRDVELEGNHYISQRVPTNIFAGLVDDILKQSPLPVHLIPMHNFYIGGDDRIFLSKVAKAVSSDRVKVMQSPMSLQETMREYHRASYCVGMRFHSIVLQTALNGRNYIVDYTNPQNGKIIGMMKKIGMEETYKYRYYSLHSSTDAPSICLEKISSFHLPERYISDALDEYVVSVKQLI